MDKPLRCLMSKEKELTPEREGTQLSGAESNCFGRKEHTPASVTEKKMSRAQPWDDLALRLKSNDRTLCLVPAEVREGIRSDGAVTDGWGLPLGFWGLNVGPLQKQGLLTTQVISLAPQ